TRRRTGQRAGTGATSGNSLSGVCARRMLTGGRERPRRRGRPMNRSTARRPARRSPHRTIAALIGALVLPLTALPALAGTAGTAATDPTRPQEPGVTMRVFDVQVPLEDYCTLKPGQTPNVDRLMPTIDWRTVDDFGFADRFVTEVTGYLDAPEAGTYEFRLTSDDGARLLLDDAVVVDHPGRHGATPKDGSATLEAGYHALRVDHFDGDHDQQLTLEWRP